ncbi:O-antigen ligase family protein [Pseudomonas sp. MDMC216]|nr:MULTISPECIES: O-antigen ligase family protein [Pseudomonas]KJU76096.1 hypothetical protein N619_25845 [Pseudomonas oleovorans]MBA4681408.1 O-antigen ligase family protein [Pseudomonas sp.]MDI5996453.1 O-antigen ligase family protein [Pseudomonas sp. MDMC216]MDI6010230.1 O-antigen ligase family protein [Pseudomonas sp. MDMC17]RAR39205.1 O-antigen ligase family protein [Pseudomonas sp. MDMC224]
MAGWRERIYNGYVGYWAPLALLAFLTGMFWIGDRSLYHKLYYATLALPTLLVALVSPVRFLHQLRQPYLVLFLVFSLYVMLSLSWSPEQNYSKLKQPLYVLMLLLAVGAMAEHDMRRLVQCVALAAVFASLFALITMLMYGMDENRPERLEGMGALYNPLLTTHVYGFFTVMVMGALVTSRRYFAVKLSMFVVLLCLLFLTGSRTPLLALLVCVGWLVLLLGDRRVIVLAAVVSLAIMLGFWGVDYNPLERGLSYRPFIWQDAWRQTLPVLWLGHGYDASIDIYLPDLDYLLADTHNLTLGVIYQTGLVGGVMWLSLYVYGFSQAWRYRSSGLVIISSVLLVYGFMAGMTEGSAFMSRPKEHWFIIWIPIALHFAVLRKVGTGMKGASA